MFSIGLFYKVIHNLEQYLKINMKSCIVFLIINKFIWGD